MEDYNDYDELLEELTDERRDELMNLVYESEEKFGYSDNDVAIIGYYADDDFQAYIEEKTLGKENFGGKVKYAVVEVRTNEGWEKPHVHILNEYINIAIRLDIPEYFVHEHAPDTFSNNKQKKKFDKFMRSTIVGTDITRWEHAKAAFNVAFPDHPLLLKKQPDYTKLP